MMRVTQSMLAQSSLNHISQSFEKMGNLQDQLSTGKKITRPSQDPVVAMNGMRYRTQTTEVEQFQRNSGEVNNWMDATDSALDEATNALQRVRELTTQAANDTYEEGQRENIAEEVSQLRDHIASIANTKSNGKYIFNGTDTTNAPIDEEELDVGAQTLSGAGEEELTQHQITRDGNVYSYQEQNGGDPVYASENGEEIQLTFDNGSGELDNVQYTHENDEGNEVTEDLSGEDIIVSRKDAVSTNQGDVNIELLKGVNITANSNPQNTFNNALFGDLKQLENKLRDPDTEGEELSEFIGTMDTHIDNVVNERAEVGARLNRVEMIEDRLGDQEVTAEKIMSENEDADMEKVITELMSQENVHQAALSSGARIIQPTLMDFLR